MQSYELTPEEQHVLDALLPVDQRTGDTRRDLGAALRVAMEIRADNTRRGTVVINAMRRAGVTWRDVTALSGVPWATARRWHEAAPGVEEIRQVDCTAV